MITDRPVAFSPVNTPPPVHNPPITSPRLKTGLFVVEGLNSMATVGFFYYIYFLMKSKFQFGALENFLLAASLGLVYAIAAIMGGRFAQKFGYLVALRLGIITMALSFALESQVSGVWLTLGLIMTANLGMCFTWPALEALVSEGEPQARLQNLIGIYNCVWAIGSALAFFVGGAMIERWGWNTMFFVPAAMQVIELAIVLWIEKEAPRQPAVAIKNSDSLPHPAEPVIVSPVRPKTFLKMALLANPFAYLAINTVVSVIPTVATKLHLDTKQSGFICSIWLFSRAASFIVLWLWPRWHYRFRFLAGAFLALGASFLAMLVTVNLTVLVLAELFFGVATGLIYYSSLFYSMDVSETKGEHGGIHEGAIGAGCCAGPAVAVCGLYFFPTIPASGAYAVTVLLLGGLGGLYWLRYRD